MYKKILLALIFFYLCLSTNAQKSIISAVLLLENDNIADVNLDQDKFLPNMKKISDLINKEFTALPTSQKIAVYYIAHATGSPDFKVYSNPKLSAALENSFLAKAKTLATENTKLVDFPILFTINTGADKKAEDFKDFITPQEQRQQEYEAADLKTKLELNKVYAAKTVLPILASYAAMVDKKFEGVKNFGTLVLQKDFTQPQKVNSFTSNNPDYWRAILEMSPDNQIIPITKIFMQVAQGEIDNAAKDIPIVRMFSSEKMVSNNYLEEIYMRIKNFQTDLKKEIEKGIAEHDKGAYDKAITIYNELLKIYPNTAWARYELYYTQNALALKNKTVKPEDRSLWDNAKISIYACNPLYNMDIRASNGKEGYLLFRRQEIRSLFKEAKNKINDVYRYADIAMDLGVYDFAAQLFWFCAAQGNEKALNRFLYCIEKLDVKKLKENFKMDYDKEFKQIETEKDKEMKNNIMYQSFKN
jgi:hypothetical protein